MNKVKEFSITDLYAKCDFLIDGNFDYKEKGLDVGRSYWFRAFLPSGAPIGAWYFSNMPGCCGVVVSHGLNLNEEYRSTGVSGLFQKLREYVAQELGYSAMIATCLTSNFPELFSSKEAGWKMGPVFRNIHRTNNDVTFQIKVLNTK